MNKTLYFARCDYHGETLWGGHIFAKDAPTARREASRIFELERTRTSQTRDLPPATECTLKVRRSTAKPENVITHPSPP